MSSVGLSLTHLALRKEQFHSGKPETKTVSNSDVAQKSSGDPTADSLWPKTDESSKFVGKWKSLLRFPRALFARLFHSFWPADSFTFPLSLLSVYVSSPRASRCDARCAPAGRGCHRPGWDLRSVRASGPQATAKSGSSSASGSDPRRFPRSLFSPVPTSGP